MSTGISVRSLSAMSLATASRGVLGRQNTTSGRMRSPTLGLFASGARRAGSRSVESVIAARSRAAQGYQRPSKPRKAAREGSVAASGRRGLLGSLFLLPLLILGEAAQDVLPALGLRLLDEGRLGERTQQPVAGARG